VKVITYFNRQQLHGHVTTPIITMHDTTQQRKIIMKTMCGLRTSGWSLPDVMSD
jgi:hypothetical protein